MKVPLKLYHGSKKKIIGSLKPLNIKRTEDHVHERPAVFATEKIEIAALFMLTLEHLHSIGFEKGIPYICIWGTPEELTKDNGGYIYVLPGKTFEKVGKEYEYQSFVEVKPIEEKFFPSAVEGMMELGVQVYFINDDATFDKIQADKNNRLPILRTLVSENRKKNFHVKKF